MPCRPNSGASHHAAPIDATFSSTGVAAGTAKWRQVLRMPDDSETSEIIPMYGNIQRVITTAPSNSARPEAISQTIAGAAKTPTTQVASRIQNSTVATASTRRCVAASPSISRDAASSGTKAAENAPSPNRRRSMLGMRKAAW